MQIKFSVDLDSLPRLSWNRGIKLGVCLTRHNEEVHMAFPSQHFTQMAMPALRNIKKIKISLCSSILLGTRIGILAGTQTDGNKSITNWDWHYLAGLGRMAII